MTKLLATTSLLLTLLVSPLVAEVIGSKHTCQFNYGNWVSNSGWHLHSADDNITPESWTTLNPKGNTFTLDWGTSELSFSSKELKIQEKYDLLVDTSYTEENRDRLSARKFDDDIVHYTKAFATNGFGINSTVQMFIYTDRTTLKVTRIEPSGVKIYTYDCQKVF